MDDIEINRKIETFLSTFDSPSVGVKLVNEYFNTKSETTVKIVTRSSPVIISMEKVSKIYKVKNEKIMALHNVTLSLYESEVVAITGSSGSGKSTLLHILGCIDTPSSGDYTLVGKDVKLLSDNQLSALRRSTLGFIFQSFYLQPFLNLRDNISTPAMFAGKSRHSIDEQASSLLNMVGLADRAEFYPRQISGGQTQRAAIARALMNNPKVLLADEPTGNLDSKNSQLIMDLFRKIRDQYGTTVVIVTHSDELASQADRIIRIKDGSII